MKLDTVESDPQGRPTLTGEPGAAYSKYSRIPVNGLIDDRFAQRACSLSWATSLDLSLFFPTHLAARLQTAGNARDRFR